MLHGRLVRPLGQGAYGDGTLARRRLGRRELDRRARRRARRAARRLPRRRRLAGVRRDPGGRAAEGRLPRRRRGISGSGNLFCTRCARSTRPGRRRRATSSLAGDPRRCASPSAAHTVSAELRLPLPGPHADRPELRGRRRDAQRARSCSATRRTPTRCATSSRSSSACRPTGSASQYWEGAARSATARRASTPGVAAAVLSQLAGAPVRLQFMRWDEHGWDNYSPAVLADLAAGWTRAGSIVALRLHRRSASPRCRWPRTPTMPARRHPAAAARARQRRRSRTPARSTTSRTGA